MLEPILTSVRSHLGDVVAAEPEWRAAARRAPAVRDMVRALAGPGLSVIAEVKRRSPSAGPIDAGLDPASRAVAYEAGGAAAVSVLTEADHFGGTPQDLIEARTAIALPVLRKDFILHPAQVWQTRAIGADAVLLIAAILDDEQLATLYRAATDAGLAALIEVHTPDEARRIASLEPDLVGVNNRDLATFAVDLAVAERIREELPEGAVCVAESGVSSPEGAARMAAAGYDAILVGEALVRSPDPARLTAALREAGS